MSTFIVGVSGKKQAGKNTLCNSLKRRYDDGDDFCFYTSKIYSFADVLKRKVCMDVMGLSYEQCYGSDKQKNSLTIYKWDKIPYKIAKHKIGFMTAREVMQIVGTNIFREYFNDHIWVNATLQFIKQDNVDIAFISDARFPSEVEGIIKNNGIVFRLLRDVCDTDSHESETALDNYNWKELGDNVCIIDNREMSIHEQAEQAEEFMLNFVVKK